MESAHAPWRMARALFAALLATSVALALHTGAHGASSVLAVVVAFIGTLWIGSLLAGRRLGVWALSAIVAFAQVAVHGLLSILSAAPIVLGGAGIAGTGIGSHAGHARLEAEHVRHLAHSAAHHTAGGTGAMSAHTDLLGPAMLTAHGLALVLTVLVLKCGEDALLGLVRLTARLAWALLEFFRPIPVSPRRLPALRDVPVPALRIAHTPALLRGPPIPLL